MWSRRQLLAAGAATLAAAPRRARAAPSAADHRFLFVTVYMGWDPTRVHYPAFHNPAVSTEPEASVRTLGDFAWVHHPERPSVSAFFEKHAARALLLNGIRVSSVSHVTCLQRMLTGGQLPGAPDWASILATSQADRYALPSVVVRGPSFVGSEAHVVSQVGANGQMRSLLDGSLLSGADTEVRTFSPATLAALDRYAARTAGQAAARAVDARAVQIVEAHSAALRRAVTLESVVDEVAWGEDRSLDTQAGIARDLLRLGLSRCVCLAHERIEWDSHQLNDSRQSANFEDLFGSLDRLMDELVATPGPDGLPLADTTHLVVLSEMGRTPALNAGLGKDHWPYTSALIVGPGVTGGRVVGDYDEWYYGRNVDPATAEVHDGGRALDASMFGATLLALGDVDPGAWLRDPTALDGVLA